MSSKISRKFIVLLLIVALLASVVAFISIRSNAVSAESSEYEYMPGAPQITVLTHGIADFNGASHWSNNYPETFDEGNKGEQTHFAYDTDSLIHKLSEKAGGADIFWAKVDNGNTDFDLYNIGGENIEKYGMDYQNAKTVTEIGSSAFSSLNTNLKKIVIPESVTKIGNYAFAYNTGVQEVEFAGNSKLKDIGSSAFYGCSNLAAISLPDGVEIIGDMAFADCPALTGTFTLPASVKNIYAGAFNDCNISAFTIASSNSKYIAESGVLYEKSGTAIGAKLVAYPAGKKDMSFTTPAAVKELGEYAIYGNYNLQSINLNNVETILNYGLSNCEKLATVTGNKVNYLGGSVLINTPWLENNAEDYVAVGSVLLNYQGNASTVNISAYSQVNDFAFALNGNVEEIIAGANTEEFGIGAFLGCNNLKNIKLLNLHHPVYVNEYTFGDNADDMVIEVPEVMKSKYETSYNNSGWDNFAFDFSKLTTNITFDSAGGSACSDGTAYYGSVIQLPQPMKAGYDFAGWYDSVSGGMAAGNKLNSGDIWTKTADNTTLYAKWNNADYIVTLDYDNGTGQSQSIEVTYLMDMPNLSAPTRPGYEFCGYFSEPDGGGVQYYDADMNSVNKWDITDDATLYADWEGKSYTVTLNKRGGIGGSSEVTAIYGEDMPAATAPVREGYVFEGYFTEMFGAGEQYYSANMTSVQPWDISINTTLYAHWSVKEFEVKVQYDSNTDWVEIDAGVLGLSNVKVYVSYGASIGELINSALVTEYKKTEYGYVSGRVLSHFELNGQDIRNIWGNTIPDLGADGSMVVLSPVYIYEEHTISFVSNVTGLTFNNITAQYGANISLPVMDSSDNIGYSFEGWYKDNLFTEYFNYTAMPDLTPTYEGNGNVTLYAKWTAITCTVKLDKQGGSGGTSSVSVQFGNAMPSATKPAKTGYTFKGYYTSIGGKGTQYYSSSMSSMRDWNIAENNYTLFAYWKPDTYSVTLNPSGGSGGTTTISVLYDASMPGGVNSPSLTGYTFAGYYSGQNGTGTQYYDADMVSVHNWDKASSTILYAYWDANKYVITLDSYGGNGGTTQITVTYGKAMPVATKPSRVGYTFDGYGTKTYGGTMYYSANMVSLRNWMETDVSVLYAQWTANEYNITFIQNGGSGGTTSKTVTYGELLPLIKFPKYTAHNFLGYYTAAGVQYYTFFDSNFLSEDYYYLYYAQPYDIAGNITLYARWETMTWHVGVWASLSDAGLTTIPDESFDLSTDENKIYYIPGIKDYDITSWKLTYQAGTVASGTSTSINMRNLCVGNYESYTLTISYTYNPQEGGCIATGTLITLADGRQVPVESLTGNEMLLVWNMYTGTFGAAPILCIDSDPFSMYEVIRLSFSDGTTVDVISEHSFFDVNLNKYVYLDRYAADYIGHCFLKQGVDGMVHAKLEDVTIVLDNTAAYSPVTYGHLCYFVNGMLSMPGGIDGLFNIFEVDGETMMYDAEAMAADIEKYGLYTYEELNTLVPVPEVMFDAVNGQYLKVAVGKGIITIEQIGELVERYADLFE